ncbi:MAG: type IV secretory system conjugative DNA transfer family protein [Chloroflexi bacterium]|nr:type IV secretory system conjugative DNA transfer family protein [Chloroflexota bacterium]
MDELPTLGKLDSLVTYGLLVWKRCISILIGTQRKGQFHTIYEPEGTPALFTGLATQVIYGDCDVEAGQRQRKGPLQSGTATRDC